MEKLKIFKKLLKSIDKVENKWYNKYVSWLQKKFSYCDTNSNINM